MDDEILWFPYQNDEIVSWMDNATSHTSGDKEETGYRTKNEAFCEESKDETLVIIMWILMSTIISTFG